MESSSTDSSSKSPMLTSEARSPILDVATPTKCLRSNSSPGNLATGSTVSTLSGDSFEKSPAAFSSFHSDWDASVASRLEGGLRQPDFGLPAASGYRPDFGVLTSVEPGQVTTPDREQADDRRVYWEAFFVNMPMFCGYAALFGLQHEIKSKLAISDDDIDASRAFGVACSFLYIFNLIFRFSHNIVFGCMGPRGRAYIAMTAMMGAMLVISVEIFILESTSMGWVMLAYALGGVAVGTFEANFLCCLTPLGPRTKHVAITAIPVGITAVLVGGFFAMGPPLYVSVSYIYTAVAVSILCGMLLFALRIPTDKNIETDSQGIRQFLTQVFHWRQWLPLVWTLPLATAIDMFSLSAFSPGVALYIFDTKTVELFPGLTMDKNDFFVIFNIFNMLGGLCGRILSYRLTPRHPLCYTILNMVGSALLLLKIPLLAPVSTFLVMMGDGLIYGSIARRIDSQVPKQFNLVALSFWLFIGDFGSVTGSNLISYIRVWVVGK